RRLDTPSKVNGAAQFGLDVRLPGMLFALVARPPVFGGKVVSFDATETLKIPGVRAVEQIPSGVAVVAERYWPAKLGREKLKISWDDGPGANLSTSQMLVDFSKLSASPGTIARKTANPASDFVIEAVNVAKVAKAPVKVVWTREDDIAGGWYRPMWHDRFVAGLDAAGNPIAWTHTIVGQSITEGTAFAPYTINKDGVESTSVEGAP